MCAFKRCVSSTSVVKCNDLRYDNSSTITHNDSSFGVIFDIDWRSFVPLENVKDILVFVDDADEFNTRHEVLQTIAAAAWIFLPRTP